MSDQLLQQLSDRLKDSTLDETILPDGSGVLLDVAGHRVLTLSSTAVFLVEQIRQGILQTRALTDALQARFDVGRDTASSDTIEFITSLATAFEIEADQQGQASTLGKSANRE